MEFSFTEGSAEATPKELIAIDPLLDFFVWMGFARNMCWKRFSIVEPPSTFCNSLLFLQKQNYRFQYEIFALRCRLRDADKR